MRMLFTFIPIAMLSGCQSTDGALSATSMATSVAGPAASAIAGDMTSRLAEQIGPAGTRSIKMQKDATEYASALEAAFKGWGYTVITDEKEAKNQKPVEISYSLHSFDGQFLAYLATPSIALGRAYNATGAGATASSPLSVMQRN